MKGGLIAYRYAVIAAVTAAVCVATVADFAGVSAAPLTTVRDLITNSQTASGSDHTISFTAPSGVPVSGRITVTPVAGGVTIPASLDFTDVDLLVAAVQRPLAAAAGSGAGSPYGVAVVTGTSGSLTFTLNNTDAISAGDTVEIRIGTNAVSGTAGDQQLVNGPLGSHAIALSTRTAGNAAIDQGSAIFVVLQPIGLTQGPTDTPSPTPTGGGGGSQTFPTPTPCGRTADFTGECLVNVVDLSILMANWGPAQPPNDMTDLNNDSAVGIIDFSVLLYWWTG